MTDEKIVISEEPLSACLDEMKPIFYHHWKELALYQDKIKLNPDYAKYLDLNEGGPIVVFTARKGGALVGYAIFFVMAHLHYQDHIYANNDIIYICEDLRSSGLGTELFRQSEAMLRAKHSVSVINVSMKVLKPFDDLMEYLGYDLVERTYSKFVGE